MKKVEALKKVISEGNYTVPAEELAPKLMASLFRNTILDEDPNETSGSQLDDRAVQDVEGGASENHNGLHSASVPSDEAATKREPELA
jgi:hypothetical protein